MGCQPTVSSGHIDSSSPLFIACTSTLDLELIQRKLALLRALVLTDIPNGGIGGTVGTYLR